MRGRWRCPTRPLHWTVCDGQVAMDAARTANATSDMHRHTHNKQPERERERWSEQAREKPSSGEANFVTLPFLTVFVSCLGSFQVVVRLLWSTKNGHPVWGSILTSHPRGSGSLSLLAIVVSIGDCVFMPFMLLGCRAIETFYMGDGRFKDSFK